MFVVLPTIFTVVDRLADRHVFL